MYAFYQLFPRTVIKCQRHQIAYNDSENLIVIRVVTNKLFPLFCTESQHFFIDKTKKNLPVMRGKFIIIDDGDF